MAADYVIVGSGINALVAAALLAKKGKKVLVLERNDRIGGCIRAEEIAPGFTCDAAKIGSPNRPMSSNVSTLLAATRIGGYGCCTGLGTTARLSTLKKRP